MLDVIRDEQLQTHAAQMGEYLLAGLHQLAQRHPLIGDVRGWGLFLGVELVTNRSTRAPAEAGSATGVINCLRERGVLLSTDGPLHNVLKTTPWSSRAAMRIDCSSSWIRRWRPPEPQLQSSARKASPKRRSRLYGSEADRRCCRSQS